MVSIHKFSQSIATRGVYKIPSRRSAFAECGQKFDTTDMDRWQNKIAVVTGASSGIGAACAKDLAEAGMIVVGLARRVERVEELRNDLSESAKNRLNAIKCDVTNEQQVVETFALIEKKFGGVDVLVNNAGIVRQTELVKENNTDELKAVIETNVLGVAYCTREAFKSMKSRDVEGHVVIINSITGHYIPMVPDFSFNIYPASKHAITAMTEVYRREFLSNKTKIKISSISPGGVLTEIVPAEFVNAVPLLRAEDVSDAVKYVIQTPPSVQIHELIIKPMGELF